MLTLIAVAILGLSLAAPAVVGVVEGPQSTFDTPELTVAVGDSVTFVNNGVEDHDIASLGEPVLFQSPVVPPGGSFTFTLKAPGDVGFVCTFHGSMVGVMHVT